VTDECHALKVRSSRTERSPNHQQPSDKQLLKDSSPTVAANQPEKPVASVQTKSGSEKKDHHLEAFGAFWLTYPKRRDKEAAKKAWTAAIERGAEPQQMVDAAKTYAQERKDQEPKYTKYPATWLNNGCYDDEPDTPPGRHLHAVGGYEPHRNHADDSDYNQGWD
jgi:DNA segregation ATPase FtsK/SpoIIIE-like protein